MQKNSRCSVNEIGRIVIPAEIRKQLGLKADTPVEIFFKDGHVHIRKFQESCILCKSVQSLAQFKDVPVCRECLRQLSGRRMSASIG